MNIVEWLDQGAANVVAPLHRGWLDALMSATTHLGDSAVVIVLTVLAAAALLARRRWRTAACVGAAVALAFLVAEVGKDLVGRKRPDVAWRVGDLPKSPSLPSGHALESMALYGTLGLTVGWRLRRRWGRVSAAVLGLCLALLIGLTRVYLGVHYLTDVLAGWGVGLALAMLAAWADAHWERNPAI